MTLAHTDEKWDEFIGELERVGGVMYLACKNVGIGHQTVYDKMGREPEFAERVHGARKLAIDKVEHAVYTDATGRPEHFDKRVQCPECSEWFDERFERERTNATAQVFYLANRDPENWKRKDGPGRAHDPREVAKWVIQFMQETDDLTHPEA